MAKLFVGDQESVWFDVDRPPFDGGLRLKIKPLTQAARDRIDAAAKKNEKYRAHHETIGGKRKLIPADQTRAWSEEACKELVDDFDGIEVKVGGAIEEIACTDEPIEIEENGETLSIIPKLLILRSGVAYGFVIEKAMMLAQVRVEEEEKN